MVVIDEKERVPPLDEAALERLSHALDREGVIAAMLIGSQARGTTGPLSDVDIAVPYGMSPGSIRVVGFSCNSNWLVLPEKLFAPTKSTSSCSMERRHCYATARFEMPSCWWSAIRSHGFGSMRALCSTISTPSR